MENRALKESKFVRVGVIGAGLFAEQCHIPYLQSHPQAEVAAICARSQNTLDRVSRLFEIKDTYQDYRELLQRDDIDAITIATPDVLHKDIAVAAINAGKHVLCEKPLAMDLDSAKEMTAAAELSGLVNMVAYTFRYSEAVRKLKSLLQSGLIGTPLHAHVQIYWGDLLTPGSLTWREQAEQSAGGIWADAGAHIFDLLAFIFGPVENISAQMLVAERAEGFAQPTTIDLASCQATVLWQDKTPVQVLAMASRISAPRGPLHEIQVVGTGGSLGIPITRGEGEYLSFMEPGSGEWKMLPLSKEAMTPEPTALKAMMHSFVDAVICGKSDPHVDASFRDGLNTHLVLAAGLESVKNSCWQKVNYMQPVAAV